MEVILKEDVVKLGSRGDVVKVAEGYGRNFLLPRKLAIEATKANKTVIEQMKASALRRSAREKGEAEQLAKQFDGVKLTFQSPWAKLSHVSNSMILPNPRPRARSPTPQGMIPILGAGSLRRVGRWK